MQNLALVGYPEAITQAHLPGMSQLYKDLLPRINILGQPALYLVMSLYSLLAKKALPQLKLYVTAQDSRFLLLRP